MDNATKAKIIERLNRTVIDLAPHATFRPMYGGTVIELSKGDPKSRVGGIFPYAKYVSLELSNGVSFVDSNGILEGKGKYRRHVKLHSLNDIDKKCCTGFLRQAILMQ